METKAVAPNSTWGLLTKIFWLDEEAFPSLQEGFDLIPNHLRIRTLSVAEMKTYSIQPNYEHDYYAIFEAAPSVEDEPVTLFTKALLAFRLHKKDWIFLDGIYFLFSFPDDEFKKIRYLPGPEINYSYRLSPEDIYPIKQILTRILNFDFEKNAAFNIACERYERSSYDVNVGDQIIDLCIGYEALFLKGEGVRSNLGIGRIVGLACSMLLGEDESERNKISDLISKTFGIRNRLVHGRHVEADEMIRVHTHFREYLRQSILKLMP